MATRSAEKSVELFEARLKKNPASRVFSRLADAYREEGDLSKAIDTCINGLRNHPEYVTGRLILGQCYMDQENYDKAIEEFKKICSVDRHNRVAIKMLAEIYSHKGSDQKADDLYSVLYKIDPLGSTTFKPGMQLPGDKDLFEILELGENRDVSQEFLNTSNEENEQLESPTTVQPTVEKNESDTLFQDEEINNISDNKPDEQIDNLYPDKTEEISGDDISSRMSDLFDNETSDDIIQTENTENTLEQNGYEGENLQPADFSINTDVSGDDVSSRIGELFAESDQQIERENNPDSISDSTFSENQSDISSHSDLDQPEPEIDPSLINGVTEYVEENVNEASEYNDLSDDVNQFTTDSTSEFEETLQFDRSLIDKIRSGQTPDQVSDMAEPEFDNLDLSNQIPAQETGKIIDYEEYSAAAFDESDSKKESLTVDSTDSGNLDDFQERQDNNWQSESPKPQNLESDQSEKFDNLIIEENENVEDIMVTEPSDQQVSGDDVAQHLDSLFSENDQEDGIEISDKELKIDESADTSACTIEGNENDIVGAVDHDLITDDSNDQEKDEDLLDSVEISLQDAYDSKSSENSLPDSGAEINDEIDSIEKLPKINITSDSDINSLESDLVELQKSDSELITDNVDLNIDSPNEENVSQEQISDNDIEQHIEKIFSESSQEDASSSGKPDPEFSEDDLNINDSESNIYSENSSYEDDNLLLEQISGNDVAQQLDTIFSEDSDQKSDITDSFNENWAQANSDNLAEESKSDSDTVSFEDQNDKTDNKNVEPEIGVNTYGEDTDSIDGPPTISGSDITDRLEEFFPDENLFGVTENALVPDNEEEHADGYSVNDFYSITGENAETFSDEDLSELDQIKIEEDFEKESGRNVLENPTESMTGSDDVMDVSSENMESMPGVISEIFDSPNPEKTTDGKSDKNEYAKGDYEENTKNNDTVIKENNSTLSDNLESAKTEIIELDNKDKELDNNKSVFEIDNIKKSPDILKITETLEELAEGEHKERSNSNSKFAKKDSEPEKISIKDSDSNNENKSDKETRDNAVASEITGKEEVMQTVAELSPEAIDERDSSFSIPDHVLTPTLADIYYHQGQVQLAIQLYQRLIKRDPDNEKLQKRLEQIKASSDQEIVDTVFYPEPEKKKTNNESVKKERRKKKKLANDNRPLAGVRIKKHKKASLAKRKKSS